LSKKEAVTKCGTDVFKPRSTINLIDKDVVKGNVGDTVTVTFKAKIKTSREDEGGKSQTLEIKEDLGEPEKTEEKSKKLHDIIVKMQGSGKGLKDV